MTSTIRLKAPPSKSLTHRILCAAALAPGESFIYEALQSADTLATRRCLEALGAKISFADDGFIVQGISKSGFDDSLYEETFSSAEPILLDVGESGTTCRFMAAIAAAIPGEYRLAGRGRMHERPIDDLVEPLRNLGVQINFEEKEGFPPLFIKTHGLAGGDVAINLSKSSQFLSGLLLAAPLSMGPITVRAQGDGAVSWPYVLLTLGVLEAAGIAVDVQLRTADGEQRPLDWNKASSSPQGELVFNMVPGFYHSDRFLVEGDWSNASYFLAAGAVGSHPINVANLNANSLQGDMAILEILALMGAWISWEPEGVTTRRPGQGKLHGLELDMSSCPDLAPTVAVLASLAEGPTILHGLAHLRLKESDRAAALASEINKTGAKVEILPGGLRIVPAEKLKSGPIHFDVYGDHRLAMSLSIYGLTGLEPIFNDPGCVDKSFPTFYDEWAKIPRV